MFKLNPCPIKFCKHGVFGELFTKYDEELQLKIKRTSLGKGQKTPITPNWNFTDDDYKKNSRLQGKLRNLKLSIANHFSIYQGYENRSHKLWCTSKKMEKECSETCPIKR